MEITQYSLFKKPDPSTLFNKDGLGDDELARLQRVVDVSKSTLGLADKLEQARNDIRSTIAFETSVNRQLRAYGLRYSLVDIRI